MARSEYVTGIYETEYQVVWTGISVTYFLMRHAQLCCAIRAREVVPEQHARARGGPCRGAAITQNRKALNFVRPQKGSELWTSTRARYVETSYRQRSANPKAMASPTSTRARGRGASLILVPYFRGGRGPLILALDAPVFRARRSGFWPIRLSIVQCSGLSLFLWDRRRACRPHAGDLDYHLTVLCPYVMRHPRRL
jgi:hypothetical protein